MSLFCVHGEDTAFLESPCLDIIHCLNHSVVLTEPEGGMSGLRGSVQCWVCCLICFPNTPNVHRESGVKWEERSITEGRWQREGNGDGRRFCEVCVVLTGQCGVLDSFKRTRQVVEVRFGVLIAKVKSASTRHPELDKPAFVVLVIVHIGVLLHVFLNHKQQWRLAPPM